MSSVPEMSSKNAAQSPDLSAASIAACGGCRQPGWMSARRASAAAEHGGSAAKQDALAAGDVLGHPDLDAGRPFGRLRQRGEPEDLIRGEATFADVRPLLVADPVWLRVVRRHPALILCTKAPVDYARPPQASSPPLGSHKHLNVALTDRFERQYEAALERGHLGEADIDSPVHAEEVARAGQRIMTCLVYLNVDYKDGETAFLDAGLKARGEPGAAVYWRNADDRGIPDRRTRHARLPPTSGQKWLLSKWFRDRPQTTVSAPTRA